MAESRTGTLRESVSALGGVLKSMYEMSPLLVSALALVVSGVTVYALTSVKLMMGIVLLVVLLVAVVVYARTGDFGQSTVALVAGVLTAYTVTWTSNKFVAFMAVWFGFTALAILISSVKLASQSESIFREAAISLSDGTDDIASIEQRLKEIANTREVDGLGPIERAEAVRLFAFRRIPVESMPSALHATVVLSIITQIPHGEVAAFVADAFKVLAHWEIDELLGDVLYRAIKESAVPPIDYIHGFQAARHLVLGGKVEVADFLDRLQRALESGVPPESVAPAIIDEEW